MSCAGSARGSFTVPEGAAVWVALVPLTPYMATVQPWRIAITLQTFPSSAHVLRHILGHDGSHAPSRASCGEQRRFFDSGFRLGFGLQRGDILAETSLTPQGSLARSAVSAHPDAPAMQRVIAGG